MKKKFFEEKKLVIASHNQGKIKEISELLNPLNIEILSAYDLNIKEPEEDGCTFEENALIKSAFVSKVTGLPCISDDSGICFSDLNNEPGIHSARWAGKEKNFDLAMLKINEAIQKIEKPSYNCYFVCALSICWPDSYNITVSGRVDGKYCWPPKGNKGFGYDPIFKPLGHESTFAEMVPKFKHNISHRSIAFKKLIDLSFPSLNS